MTNKEALNHLRSMLGETSPIQIGIFRRQALQRAVQALEHFPEPNKKDQRLVALECDECHSRQDPTLYLSCNRCGSTELKSIFEEV